MTDRWTFPLYCGDFRFCAGGLCNGAFRPSIENGAGYQVSGHIYRRAAHIEDTIDAPTDPILLGGVRFVAVIKLLIPPQPKAPPSLVPT